MSGIQHDLKTGKTDFLFTINGPAIAGATQLLPPALLCVYRYLPETILLCCCSLVCKYITLP